MTEQSDARKQAALNALTSSGHFTLEQSETIAEAIRAAMDLLRQQMHDFVQTRFRPPPTSDTESHTQSAEF